MVTPADPRKGDWVSHAGNPPWTGIVMHIELLNGDTPAVVIYTVYWLGKGESWHTLSELTIERRKP